MNGKYSLFIVEIFYLLADRYFQLLIETQANSVHTLAKLAVLLVDSECGE